jgi:hypothetical protein
MLNFFRFLGGTAAFILLGFIVASIFVRNFWRRYVCPYRGLMGLVSMLSPLRIRRNELACIDCPKCARLVRRTSRSTSWCRSAPPNVLAAWNPLRCVPARRAHDGHATPEGRTHPLLGGCDRRIVLWVVGWV